MVNLEDTYRTGDSKKCEYCNGRGYFLNHFNMKVNCRECYGTGDKQ
jgi:DnaJ-class molecular chaperone